MKPKSPEEEAEYAQTFVTYSKNGDGILDKESFLTWQNAMGELSKAEYGFGLFFNAEESAIVYAACNCLCPDYEGVMHADMARCGVVHVAKKAQDAAAEAQ